MGTTREMRGRRDEQAPGNIEYFIKTILSATIGKHDNWRLDSNNEKSNFYSKLELFKRLNIQGHNNSGDYKNNVLENLVGLGILEAERQNIDPEIPIETIRYRVNIKRLKDFDRPSQQPQ